MVNEVQIGIRQARPQNVPVQLVRRLDARAEGLLRGHVHALLGALAPILDRGIAPGAEDGGRDTQVEREPVVVLQGGRHVCSLGVCITAVPDVHSYLANELFDRAIAGLCPALPPRVPRQRPVERRQRRVHLCGQLARGVGSVHRDMDVQAAHFVELPAGERLEHALPHAVLAKSIVASRTQENEGIFREGGPCKERRSQKERLQQHHRLLSRCVVQRRNRKGAEV
mmetsp:Transcript_115896/g.368514  ORF Transcript_115896/g.368514 Transcript_115896/m.368514 type:complete len:226 (-) Transcript_115896:13-690(-)